MIANTVLLTLHVCPDVAEGYSTSYMDPYGAMRTSNPMYRDPEESKTHPALWLYTPLC